MLSLCRHTASDPQNEPFGYDDTEVRPEEVRHDMRIARSTLNLISRVGEVIPAR